MKCTTALSVLLAAQCCLIGGANGAADVEPALQQSLYNQLDSLKHSLDAIILLVKHQFDTNPVCLQEEALGMEDDSIPDDHLTASSCLNNDVRYGPDKARLGESEAWIGNSNDARPWVQVDFGRQVYVTGVITQGRPTANEWVREYEVMCSDDSQSWDFLSETDGTPTRFTGNTDRNTQVTTKFPLVLRTRFLRLLPTTWQGHRTMRFEVTGCYPLEI